LVGTSPLTSSMALRLGLRYEGGVFHFTRSKDLKERLMVEDKQVVAAGSHRLVNVRGCVPFLFSSPQPPLPG
jgi:hypothetical protein